MDRETVRVVLLIVGLLVIVGVYVWGVYRQQILDFLHRRGDFDEVQFDPDNEDELDIYDENDYDEEPVVRRREPHFSEHKAGEESAPPPPMPRSAPEPPPARGETAASTTSIKNTTLGAPFLIQVSVIGKNDKTFNGKMLRETFYELGLMYGEMGIYHRMDKNLKDPLFSIASMVEPGTFPRNDMDTFQCPGIVLFFQPAKVPDPLEVFDNLMDTCHELSAQLDGIEWDETRQPLSLKKIADMRHRLSMACQVP